MVKVKKRKGKTHRHQIVANVQFSLRDDNPRANFVRIKSAVVTASTVRIFVIRTLYHLCFCHCYCTELWLASRKKSELNNTELGGGTPLRKDVIIENGRTEIKDCSYGTERFSARASIPIAAWLDNIPVRIHSVMLQLSCLVIIGFLSTSEHNLICRLGLVITWSGDLSVRYNQTPVVCNFTFNLSWETVSDGTWHG